MPGVRTADGGYELTTREEASYCEWCPPGSCVTDTTNIQKRTETCVLGILSRGGVLNRWEHQSICASIRYVNIHRFQVHVLAINDTLTCACDIFVCIFIYLLFVLLLYLFDLIDLFILVFLVLSVIF